MSLEKTNHIIEDARVADLCAMLRWRRPAGTDTERAFIKRFILPLGVEQDAAGNLIKRIGDAPVLWSSHTDTVHSKAGVQNVAITPHGEIFLAEKGESSCLGADCATGVWLMRHMIQAGVPGLYIFHRGEEIGGVGSRHIAEKTPQILDGIQHAIAFDRRGYDSIITHQGGARCASDAFAASLAPLLPPGMKADGGGTFTDTAHYVDLIPECSNLSVGYHDAHSANEWQSAPFAVQLLEALCRLDVSALTVSRKPGEDDWESYGGFGMGWATSAGYGSRRSGRSGMTMEEVVTYYPDEVADALERWGVTVEDLLAEIGRDNWR